MKKEHWETIKKCAFLEDTKRIPVGLIVDSPWIPGYVGITTTDYFTKPDIWLKANKKVKADFPDIIFIPDFWVEYGMATEPSGFGCKISFYPNKTPSVNHLISSADDIESIAGMNPPNPETDGLMPFALNMYRHLEPRVKEIGEAIKIVAARGPLTIASHLMGLTEFLVALKTDPVNTHRLLRLTTAMTRLWLQAQAEVLSEVEGILVLDDVTGFLSNDDFLEFAHPYMKEIFNAFKGCIKIFHNDTDNPTCYRYLPDLGINIFNFTHKQNISKVRELTGSRICLMGNVPPLDILTNGSPEEVRKTADECLQSLGQKTGIILSAGGGVSPGTPGINIQALADAVL